MLTPKPIAHVTHKELMIFWQQLSPLVNANISLSKSLLLLLNQPNQPAYRQLLQSLYNDLANGQEFNQALARFPLYFNPFIRHLIHIGEQTGKLYLILEKICAYLQHNQKLQQQWQQALSYPVLLLITALCTIFSMLYWLVPQFQQIFSNSSQPLPLLTRIILKSSAILHNTTCVTTIISLGLMLSLGLWRKIKLQYHGQLIWYACPGIKHIMEKHNLINFTSNLALILQTAIPLTTALQLMIGLFQKTTLTQTIYMIYNDVNSGKNLHSSLARFSCYPNFMVQMIRLGEESGNLTTMLNKLADIYTLELTNTLYHISKLLEPLLILLVGALIGIIVIAMYLPLIHLGNQI